MRSSLLCFGTTSVNSSFVEIILPTKRMRSICLGFAILICAFRVNARSRDGDSHEIRNPEEIPSMGAFESDMILNTRQLAAIQEGVKLAEVDGQKDGTVKRYKRKATTDAAAIWPDGVVPYEFDSSLEKDKKEAALKTMQLWEEITCVRFRPKKPTDRDYVVLYKGDGCSSGVGRQIGEQKISIANDCQHLGVMAHEIGHTLGLFHEQSRPNRDKYVTIQFDNVRDDQKLNFKKYDLRMVQDHNVPYDLSSIMHYAGWYFSKNNKPTIEAKEDDMQPVMGQREQISFYDAQIINTMYKCSAKCMQSDSSCGPIGYIGPDCKCVCPVGLTGPFCREPDNKSDCGGILKGDTGQFSTRNYPQNYSHNENCGWLIKNTPGGMIVLKFIAFDVEPDSACYYDYVEIRQNGPQVFGPRFCGKGPKKEITITNRDLYIRFHSDGQDAKKGFLAKYKIVPTAQIPVNGGWSTWGSWTRCGAECGISAKARFRTCTNPPPANTGKTCEGLIVDMGKCELEPCK